ncbi:integrase catalytic domain-containing protein [Trichonephila clavipes]|nr:integrase catalytic domain-containing protein [Trichonephila clavipes]
MQRLWKQQLQLDERVHPDITLEWEQLAKDVQLVKDIKMPRFLYRKNQHLTNNSQDKSYSTETCLTSSTRIVWSSSIGSHASRWKTFVANRVAKIQTLSSATQWHHISGNANPATRGVSSSTLLTSIWLCGPKFLHETFPVQTDSSVPSLNDAVP